MSECGCRRSLQEAGRRHWEMKGKKTWTANNKEQHPGAGGRSKCGFGYKEKRLINACCCLLFWFLFRFMFWYQTFLLERVKLAGDGWSLFHQNSTTYNAPRTAGPPSLEMKDLSSVPAITNAQINQASQALCFFLLFFCIFFFFIFWTFAGCDFKSSVMVR